MIKGSQKSVNFSKTFCFLLNYIEQCEDFTKELFEAHLELFTVLFIKSEDIVRDIFMADLEDIIYSIESDIENLFINKKFGMEIIFFRIF